MKRTGGNTCIYTAQGQVMCQAKEPYYNDDDEDWENGYADGFREGFNTTTTSSTTSISSPASGGGPQYTHMNHVGTGRCVHPFGGNAATNPHAVYFNGCDHVKYPHIAHRMTPKGSIQHGLQKDLCLLPEKGTGADIANNTKLFYRPGCDTDAAIFRTTHRGALQHVESGKCVHPEGGTAWNNTPLVLHDGCDSDPAKMQISFGPRPPPRHTLPAPVLWLDAAFATFDPPDKDGIVKGNWPSLVQGPKGKTLHCKPVTAASVAAVTDSVQRDKLRLANGMPAVAFESNGRLPMVQLDSGFSDFNNGITVFAVYKELGSVGPFPKLLTLGNKPNATGAPSDQIEISVKREDRLHGSLEMMTPSGTFWSQPHVPIIVPSKWGMYVWSGGKVPWNSTVVPVNAADAAEDSLNVKVKTRDDLNLAQPFNATRSSNFIGKSNWGDGDGSLNGLLSEMIIFNRQLTLPQQNQVLTYLRNKYVQGASTKPLASIQREFMMMWEIDRHRYNFPGGEVAGTDIGGVVVSDMDACYNKCATTPNCQAATYHIQSNRCWIKEKIGRGIYDPMMQTKHRYWNPSQIVTGTPIEGPADVDGPSECESMCGQGCAAAQYDVATSRCWALNTTPYTGKDPIGSTNPEDQMWYSKQGM